MRGAAPFGGEGAVATKVGQREILYAVGWFGVFPKVTGALLTNLSLCDERTRHKVDTTGLKSRLEMRPR